MRWLVIPLQPGGFVRVEVAHDQREAAEHLVRDRVGVRVRVRARVRVRVRVRARARVRVREWCGRAPPSWSAGRSSAGWRPGRGEG